MRILRYILAKYYIFKARIHERRMFKFLQDTKSIYITCANKELSEYLLKNAEIVRSGSILTIMIFEPMHLYNILNNAPKSEDSAFLENALYDNVLGTDIQHVVVSTKREMYEI